MENNHSKIEAMLKSCNNVIDKARERNLKSTNETRLIQYKTQMMVELLTLKCAVGLDADQEDVAMMRTLTNDLIVLIEAQLLVSCN